MPIKIALIISIVLQFGAAIIALSLTRRTRTNIAWWLISIAFLLMAFRRVFELFQLLDSQNRLITGLLSTWTGVVISILMLGSLIFIRHIFDIQKRMERMRHDNELRVLSAIVRTEENERLHFSKELHDGLGPLLSGVKMALSAIKMQDTEKSDQVLENAEKLIDESILSIREISNKLSPHILNNFGLAKAIQSFIDKLPESGGPVLKFTSEINGKRFHYNVEVLLYRVACELISNSLKHAGAHNVFITISCSERQIQLDYLDDGKGFDTALLSNDQQGGLGFANMHSRVKSLNGTIDIYSREKEGVRINITIPLSEPEKKNRFSYKPKPQNDV